jgi:hypothetical protein
MPSRYIRIEYFDTDGYAHFSLYDGDCYYTLGDCLSSFVSKYPDAEVVAVFYVSRSRGARWI